MKGITLTIVTPKIQSVNYGETIGNVSTLKKLTTGTDNPKKLITYFSDKAVKYDVKRIGRDQYGWNLMNKSVVSIFVQNYENGNFNYGNFLKDMIANYEEFDLFGGMFADIGNVSDEIKQTITDENALNSFVNGLSEDTEMVGNNSTLKVSKIKEYLKYLKLLLDNSGKTITVQDKNFSVNNLKTNESISELETLIKKRNIEIKIDGASVDKEAIKKIIQASKIIKDFIGHEVSYKKSLSIDDTNKLKRSQPVRFSNGYSISEFVYDMNLLNDIDAFNRYIQYTAGQKKQSLVYPEEHLSYYTYTLTIDLDKVGAYEKEEDGKIVFEPVIVPEIRAKRVNDILQIVLLYLNRKIKGRDEKLTPIFLIGGVYDFKHPFFMNSLYFWEENQKLHLKGSDIQKILEMYSALTDIKENTFLYYDESFVNVIGNLCLSKIPLQEILNILKTNVYDYYQNTYYENIENLIKKVQQKGKDISSYDTELNEIKREQDEIKNEDNRLKEKTKNLIDRRTQLVNSLIKEIGE